MSSPAPASLNHISYGAVRSTTSCRFLIMIIHLPHFLDTIILLSFWWKIIKYCYDCVNNMMPIYFCCAVVVECYILKNMFKIKRKPATHQNVIGCISALTNVVFVVSKNKFEMEMFTWYMFRSFHATSAVTVASIVKWSVCVHQLSTTCWLFQCIQDEIYSWLKPSKESTD